jgi:hypothetical protein
MPWTGKAKQIDEVRWEIPQDYKPGMRVPARIYADAEMFSEMRKDLTLEQTTNMAFLKGIYKYAIVLPDGHQGYSHTSKRVRAKGFLSEELPLQMPRKALSVPVV